MSEQVIDINKLWLDYKANHSLQAKHLLINNYLWLVKYVLQHMNLPVNTILENDDFINFGILGLNEALERYDPERGVKFESYAVPRIKGTIQDELRKLDWLSRTARKKAQDYLQATDQLRSKYGREATIEEIRLKLNVSETEYFDYLSAVESAKATLYLSETTQAQLDEDDRDYIEDIPDDSQVHLLDIIESEERLNFIVDFLKKLNQRKREVMNLYYYENLTFKEIGELLNISESRVCQIHSQVVGELKGKLKEFDNA